MMDPVAVVAAILVGVLVAGALAAAAGLIAWRVYLHGAAPGRDAERLAVRRTAEARGALDRAAARAESLVGALAERLAAGGPESAPRAERSDSLREIRSLVRRLAAGGHAAPGEIGAAAAALGGLDLAEARDLLETLGRYAAAAGGKAAEAFDRARRQAKSVA